MKPTALPAQIGDASGAPQTPNLPALIDRATMALGNARTSAEVLEARDIAGAVYDVAKRTARLMRVRQAHDELVAAAYRAQGDALMIESQAKIRLADEYDAAQERGEVASQGKPVNIPDGNVLPTAADIGLTPKQVHEAREIRDAERDDPGVVRRTIDERVRAGEEPTKAALREAIRSAPRQAPAITGDPAVYHAIYETRQRIIPLGIATDAIRRFPPQLRHALTSSMLDELSAWFSDAADEWRKQEGQACRD